MWTNWSECRAVCSGMIAGLPLDVRSEPVDGSATFRKRPSQVAFELVWLHQELIYGSKMECARTHWYSLLSIDYATGQGVVGLLTRVYRHTSFVRLGCSVTYLYQNNIYMSRVF